MHEYANTLNTLYTNKLALLYLLHGFLVPQTQISYDSLNHLLHYDLAVSCAIHTYSYKIHNTYVHNTHLEQWTVYSLTYVRILYTVHYGNMQHAVTVVYTRHIRTRCALNAGVYMLTAQATLSCLDGVIYTDVHMQSWRLVCHSLL